MAFESEICGESIFLGLVYGHDADSHPNHRHSVCGHLAQRESAYFYLIGVAHQSTDHAGGFLF